MQFPYHRLILGLLTSNFVVVSEPEGSSSKPCWAKMPHVVLCVCAGASAQGKKAPCRVVVLCGRVLLVRGVVPVGFLSPIGFGITG